MKRLVPSLLIDEQGAWVTKQFEKSIYLGEPSNVVRMFNEMLADELAVTWVGKDLGSRNRTLSLISSQASMPLTFSGKIDSPLDALEIIRMGFERVCITSAYLENAEIASQISDEIGRSSVVLKIPVVRHGASWQIWNWKASRSSGLALEELLQKLPVWNIGEIILISVDKNGMRSGVDKHVLSYLAGLEGLRKGYEGGVSSAEEVKYVWNEGIDAVYAASFLMLFGQFRSPLVDYPEFEEQRYLD
jgi:cyclase